MVVVCLPVWAGWDVVMLAVGVCRGGVFSPGLGGRCLAGCGGAGLVAGGGRRCDGMSAAAGGPAVLGRGCERVACEGMCGQAACACRGLGGRVRTRQGGSCCEGSAARGSRCGTWRGGGVGGGLDHLCDESVVSRSFVPGVACRCVGGGAVAGLGISSAFGFASRLLKLLSVAGFSPCGGHRMCVERRSVLVFVSAFQLIVSSCASPCPVGLSRCTAVVLAASLPVGDRGARSGRFFGAWSVDSDKLWCKGIG